MSHYKISFVPNTENHCWNKAFDLIRPDSTVLDVGCSTGDFGRALIEHKGCIVDGVEPDRGDAQKARKVLRDVYNGFVEDAFEVDFKDRKYDHIVFMDVIEHLYNPETVLRDLKQRLKPNGSIIFSIPNMAHVSVRLMLLGGDFEYGNTGLLDNTHLHYYTKREVNRVFIDAGYIVNIMDYTEATYPRQLVSEELLKLGLKPSKKSLDMLTNAEASIFQFVGSAVVSNNATIDVRTEYSPDPQGQIVRSYDQRIADLTNELDAKRSEVDDCNKIIKELQQKLGDEDYLASQVRLRKYMKNYVDRKTDKLT